MAQRSKVRGADLEPSDSQHVGMLNAEKCVRYLRGIGVEIDDATADAWLDSQAVHRFLRSGKKACRSVEAWTCQCGAMVGFRETGRGRHREMKELIKDRKKTPRPPARCESCGTGWRFMSLQFVVTRDGAVRDYRRGVNRVTPLRLDEFAGGL